MWSRAVKRGFAGFSMPKPQKLEDKVHIPTLIVSLGEFLNTANGVIGSFCKADHHASVGIVSDKARYNIRDYSKDLLCHNSYKNEAAKNKSSFVGPSHGHFYRIEMDVLKFEPENNKIICGERFFTYDHLIVAAELNFDFTKVANLEKSLKDYWNSRVVTTAQNPLGKNCKLACREFRGGNMFLCLPKMPYKQPGTPLHMFWWRDELVKDKQWDTLWHQSKFFITSAESFIHPVPSINDDLLNLAQEKKIEVLVNHTLKDIKYNSINDAHRVAELIFEDNHGNTVVKPYNYAAVYPDCRVPKALADSSLVDPTSKLITLDKYTLKHTKFENVYALGECTDLPTVSNALAQFPQTDVVVKNVLAAKKNTPLPASYDGLTALPLFLGAGKLIVPGFKYGWEPVGCKFASSVKSNGLAKSLSFKVFKNFEKKLLFEKKFHGKSHGPPNWKWKNSGSKAAH